MATSEDKTEMKCPVCGQRVPLRRDGTRVTHYERLTGKYQPKQRKCAGSQEGKL